MRLRLSFMMLVQYLIWGAWYVSMGAYLNQTLKATGGQIGLAYTSTAIGAMVSPFFVGMIADRFFATERILAALHLIGAGLLCVVASADSFAAFYPVLVLYTICYMPTLALTNSLSFCQMTDISKDFPVIKTLGSFGWIVAGLIVGQLGIEKTNLPFWISAGASVLMAVYCLTLPHTPPKGAGKRVTASDVLGLEALKLMRDRSFAVFVIGSFLLCVPLTFYFSFMNAFLNEIGVTGVAAKMTLGQVSDIVFLLLMPLVYARLGVKRMLLIGMTAWALRFVLFAMFARDHALVPMMYAGILLHGIFFVMGQIYVDRRAPAHLRATAQGFIAFVTLGMGMFVGAYLSGVVVGHYTIPVAAGADPRHDWVRIWMAPAIAAGAVLLLFAFLFRDRPQDQGGVVAEEEREAVGAGV
jgi:nucleoside transporter